MQTSRKIKLAFFSAVSLANGRGTEYIITEFIRNAPISKFSISIIESGAGAMNWQDSLGLGDVVFKPKTFLFENNDEKFDWMKKNLALFMLFEVLLRPALLYYQRFVRQRSILEQLREQAFDAIYVGFNEYLPFVRGANSKIILSTHNLPAANPFISKMLLVLFDRGLYYRGITGFHFYPRFQNIIHKNSSVPILVLPNGVDAKLFKPAEQTNTVVRLFFAAYLEKKKGIIDLIEIFALMHVRNVELHIAGEGPLSDLVRRCASTNSNIHFHGGLKRPDLAELLSKCDIFVYPTKRDNLPTVVMQALSAGLHVIVSDLLSGSYEDLERLGYLEYDSFLDRGKLARKLENLCTNIESIRKQKIEQHEYIKENYDWQSISDKFYAYIEKIVNGTS